MRPLPPIPEWVLLEHEVAKILTQQEIHGWYFDERAAWKLASSLRTELEQTCKLLRDRHPFVAGPEFTPKRNNKTSGYIEGCTFTRIKETNPTSRDHISWILQTHYGWKPTQFAKKTNKPIIDEVILKEIGTEISLQFLTCLDITKKLGMISEGVNAWLRLCTNANRIHHHASVGTNTHRCSHRKPNLTCVPSENEFRELFQASPGQLMVGADLAGIELRMLAHYLARFDGGRYADILLNGDIHQVNADALKVTRRQVKAISYCFTYGGGNAKLGHTFDPQLSEAEATKKGAEIRKKFVKAIPGLQELLAAVKKKATEKGFLLSIDGRPIKVDSPHKALNYLLQSAAAVVAKRWMVINQNTIKETGLCASQLAFIHDELQFECAPEHADDLSTSLVFSAAAAGEYYNLRIPIEAEAKKGRDWSEVH